jgi:hypothetical protein
MERPIMTRSIVLVACFALGGCFELTPMAGALRCAQSGKPCPDGWACDPGSHTCWPADQLPDAATGPAVPAGSDGGSVEPNGGPSTLATGESCSPGGTPCASGHCVDGVCCDRACSGACEACDLQGSRGTCSLVSQGQPLGGRTACGGSGACAGSCTGASPHCSFPAGGTVCGAACDGTCDGAGQCSSSGGGACPGGFACDSASCRTDCNIDAHCQPNFACSAGQCQRVPESDCSDGADNNGDGLADCLDPTCTAVAECVPEVAAGNEVGVLVQAGAACPAGYGPAQEIYQNPKVPNTCSGCGCTPNLACTFRLRGAGSACGEQIFSWTDYSITVRSNGPFTNTNDADLCVTTGAHSSMGFSVTNQQATCAPSSGAAARPGAVTWGTSMRFCPVQPQRKSPHCAGAGQLCVPRAAAGTFGVRVPATNVACPGGYAAQSPAVYYGGGNDTRQCDCDCRITNQGTCNASTNTFRTSESACFSASYATETMNGSSDCEAINSSHRRVWLRSFSGGGATCSASGDVYTGAFTPTGGVTFCQR